MKEIPPLEGLLHPPWEWTTTLLAIIYAVIIFCWPVLFGLDVHTACLGSGVLLTIAWVRFYQGLSVVRYQCRLIRLRPYILAAHQVPVSDQTLFLGKGFYWKPLYTQRLRELDI